MKGIDLLNFLQGIDQEVLKKADVYFDTPDSANYYNVESVTTDKLNDIVLKEMSVESSTEFDEIFNKLKKIISDVLNIDEDIIEIGTYLKCDLDVDSIDIVDITRKCEKEFNIDLGDELFGDYFSDITMEDIVYLIDKKISEKQ